MPLAGTRMFHPRFQQHHRPVADRQATAQCVITRPSSTPVSWDDVAGRHVYPPPTTIYFGPCRIQQVAPGGRVVVADRATPVADYRVTIPADSPVVQVNDLVDVTAEPDNPDLVGETLTVTAVPVGSIVWQRDLTCQLQPPTTR